MLFSFQILSFILATLRCFRHRRERSFFLHMTARCSFDPCAERSCVWGNAPPRGGTIWNALPRRVGRLGMRCAPRGKFLPAFSVQGRSAGPEAGRGVPTPPSLPLDSTHPATQQLRPPPAAETGSSCWDSGQQDASAAQGTKRMLGAATRRQGLHALDNPKEEVEAQKS